MISNLVFNTGAPAVPSGEAEADVDDAKEEETTDSNKKSEVEADVDSSDKANLALLVMLGAAGALAGTVAASKKKKDEEA